MRDKLIYILAIIAAVLIAFNLYRIFLILPDEANQGAIYRIIYFHVPSAITSFIGFFVALLASAGYLTTKDLRNDAISAATVEVSLVFATVVLVTGSIW